MGVRVGYPTTQRRGLLVHSWRVGVWSDNEGLRGYHFLVQRHRRRKNGQLLSRKLPEKWWCQGKAMFTLRQEHNEFWEEADNVVENRVRLPESSFWGPLERTTSGSNEKWPRGQRVQSRMEKNKNEMPEEAAFRTWGWQPWEPCQELTANKALCVYQYQPGHGSQAT